MRRTVMSGGLMAAAAMVVTLVDPLRGLPAGGYVRWLTSSPEAALGVLAACTAWGLALWLGIVLGLGLLAGSRPPASRCARGTVTLLRCLIPRTMRPLLQPLLRGALGGAILLSSAAPALAAGPTPSAPAATVSNQAPAPGLPLPALSPVPPPLVALPEQPLPSLDWVNHTRIATVPATPPASPVPAVPPASPAPNGPASRHQVAAGDTLWGIAANALPAGSSDAAITDEWQRIYEANRSVVGPDPSFLLPGEALTIVSAS